MSVSQQRGAKASDPTRNKATSLPQTGQRNIRACFRIRRMGRLQHTGQKSPPAGRSVMISAPHTGHRYMTPGLTVIEAMR